MLYHDTKPRSCACRAVVSPWSDSCVHIRSQDSNGILVCMSRREGKESERGKTRERKNAEEGKRDERERPERGKRWRERGENERRMEKEKREKRNTSIHFHFFISVSYQFERLQRICTSLERTIRFFNLGFCSTSHLIDLPTSASAQSPAHLETNRRRRDTNRRREGTTGKGETPTGEGRGTNRRREGHQQAKGATPTGEGRDTDRRREGHRQAKGEARGEGGTAGRGARRGEGRGTTGEGEAPTGEGGTPQAKEGHHSEGGHQQAKRSDTTGKGAQQGESTRRRETPKAKGETPTGEGRDTTGEGRAPTGEGETPTGEGETPTDEGGHQQAKGETPTGEEEGKHQQAKEGPSEGHQTGRTGKRHQRVGRRKRHHRRRERTNRRREDTNRRKARRHQQAKGSDTNRRRERTPTGEGGTPNRRRERQTANQDCVVWRRWAGHELLCVQSFSRQVTAGLNTLSSSSVRPTAGLNTLSSSSFVSRRSDPCGLFCFTPKSSLSLSHKVKTHEYKVEEMTLAQKSSPLDTKIATIKPRPTSRCLVTAADMNSLYHERQGVAVVPPTVPGAFLGLPEKSAVKKQKSIEDDKQGFLTPPLLKFSRSLSMPDTSEDIPPPPAISPPSPPGFNAKNYGTARPSFAQNSSNAVTTISRDVGTLRRGYFRQSSEQFESTRTRNRAPVPENPYSEVGNKTLYVPAKPARRKGMLVKQSNVEDSPEKHVPVSPSGPVSMPTTPVERTCSSIPIPTIIIKEPSTSSSGKSSQGSSMEIEPTTPEHPPLMANVPGSGGLRPDDPSLGNPFAAAIAGAVRDREKRLEAKKNSIAFQSIDMGDDEFSGPAPTPRLRQSKSIDEGMFSSDERLRRILAPSSAQLGKPVGGGSGNMTDFNTPEPTVVREPLSTRTGQCPNFDSPASLPATSPKSHYRANGTYLHPVTGKPLDPNSPLALALAARDRAMKEQQQNHHRTRQLRCKLPNTNPSRCPRFSPATRRT
ncbi:hypothetical protein WMY93_033916 [Mugilogobius chulae]|uniref:Uncharacterized protein n=1 Tax=Mugilogobius chulae TaxID=88201 RepID=A0AAW0MLW3_9GOBI